MQLRLFQEIVVINTVYKFLSKSTNQIKVYGKTELNGLRDRMIRNFTKRISGSETKKHDSYQYFIPTHLIQQD